MIRSRQVFLCLVLAGIFILLPSGAFAASTCAVSPFSRNISQGESTKYTLLITPDTKGVTTYEIKTGNLPLSVERGFTGSVTDIAPTSTDLIFTAKGDAQVGSFLVSIFYRELVLGQVKEAKCVLNLVVNKKVPLRATSSDALTRVPIGMTSEVAKGVLPAPRKEEVKKETTASLGAGISGEFKRTLQYGSKGEDVTRLQEVLVAKGFFPKGEVPTGFFGKITRQAVTDFQIAKNLPPVGIAGPRTRAEIIK